MLYFRIGVPSPRRSLSPLRTIPNCPMHQFFLPFYCSVHFYGSMYHSWFNRLPIEGHLDYFLFYLL